MWGDSGSDLPPKEEDVSTALVQLTAPVGNIRVWLSMYSHSDLWYKMCTLAGKH